MPLFVSSLYNTTSFSSNATLLLQLHRSIIFTPAFNIKSCVMVMKKILQFQCYKTSVCSIRYLSSDSSQQFPRLVSETVISDSSKTLELAVEVVETLLCSDSFRASVVVDPCFSGLLKVWSSSLVQPKVEPEVVMLQCLQTQQLHYFFLESKWL